MTTCGHSQATLFADGPEAEESTSSSAASRANRSAWPASNSPKTTSAIYGRICSESFKRSGLAGSLARMLTESSVWRSTLYALTWKVRATPSSRSFFQLAASPLRIADTDAGSSDIFPTPRAIYGAHPGMSDPSHLTGAAGAAPESSLRLSAEWTARLMGFPDGYLDLDCDDTSIRDGAAIHLKRFRGIGSEDEAA